MNKSHYLAFEDLADFYRRWPDLRNEAVKIADSSLDADQRVLLKWMVFVVDRVGPIDLELNEKGEQDGSETTLENLRKN